MTNEQLLELEVGTKLVITEDGPLAADLLNGDIVELSGKVDKEYVDGDGNIIFYVKDKEGYTWGISVLHAESLTTIKKENKTMTNKLNLKVKKLSERATIPTYGSEKAAGADLYACLPEGVESITVNPGETVKFGTGVAFELPEGYATLIMARSGLSTKHGLAPANKVGLCDEDYRGEYIVGLHNHSNIPYEVKHGERIAQLVIIPYIQGIFNEVGELSDTQRGAGGFGSTGKN